MAQASNRAYDLRSVRFLVVLYPFEFEGDSSNQDENIVKKVLNKFKF